MNPADTGSLWEELLAQASALQCRDQQLDSMNEMRRWRSPGVRHEEYPGTPPEALHFRGPVPRLPPPEHHSGAPGSCRPFLVQCDSSSSSSPLPFPQREHGWHTSSPCSLAEPKTGEPQSRRKGPTSAHRWNYSPLNPRRFLIMSLPEGREGPWLITQLSFVPWQQRAAGILPCFLTHSTMDSPVASKTNWWLEIFQWILIRLSLSPSVLVGVFGIRGEREICQLFHRLRFASISQSQVGHRCGNVGK